MVKSTKTIFGLFLCMLFMYNGFAQKDEFTQRYYSIPEANFEQYINEVYGDKAEELVFERETKKIILKDFLNRIAIVELNPALKMPEAYQDLSSLGEYGYTEAPDFGESIDPELFNPFYYKIDKYVKRETQYIHITGTNFYLKVKPFDIDKINKLRNN